MDFSYLDDWEEGAPEIDFVGEGHRNIWVFAETVEGTLLPATLEAMGQARELADQIGCYVFGLLMGQGVSPLADQLIAYGADKVLVEDDGTLATYQPEIYVHNIACLAGQHRPEILLIPATTQGSDLAPRLAQRLNTGLASRCIKLGLDMSERLLLSTFPVMNREMYHTVACPTARPQMATLNPGHFPIPYEDGQRSGKVEQVEIDPASPAAQLRWTDSDAHADLPPIPLAKARIVVSGGRGMGSRDGFSLVEQLAQALGGFVAGSRGAYDEGWITEEQIVGVGGQVIGPDLYIACGLSGDVYHCFGLQQAKFILAINLDENAPIMKVANVALVGDAMEVIPAMLNRISAGSQTH